MDLTDCAAESAAAASSTRPLSIRSEYERVDVDADVGIGAPSDPQWEQRRRREGEHHAADKATSDARRTDKTAALQRSAQRAPASTGGSSLRAPR